MNGAKTEKFEGFEDGTTRPERLREKLGRENRRPLGDTLKLTGESWLDNPLDDGLKDRLMRKVKSDEIEEVEMR